MKLWFFCAFLLVNAACDNFEYSPNQAFDRTTPRDLNNFNLEKLRSAPLNDDTVTIAFVGDSQRFYEEVDAFVTKVNTLPEVDFIILAGDVTDFGLLSEFEWVHRSFSKLDKPYFAVIGNHDVIGNGENVFQRMYGALNYSFEYDSVRFVIHNTNGREYPGLPVPDLQWLAEQLKPDDSGAIRHYIAVSHVPPDHADFKKHLSEPYGKLFRSTPGFVVSLHGHIHSHKDYYPFNDGVRYITSFAFNEPSFVLLKIKDDVIRKHIISY